MRIFVTGATGFIGSTVVKELLGAGHKVIGLTRSKEGAKRSVVRLAPVVHDREKQGLVSRMIDIAQKKGVSGYVGTGDNRWPAVHRLDAASLFRLALEKGAAGARYHAIAEEGVPVRTIAELIGERLVLPVVSKSADEAAKHFGWLATFVSADNPASNGLTQERLGWRPIQSELFSDLRGSYSTVRSER